MCLYLKILINSFPFFTKKKIEKNYEKILYICLGADRLFSLKKESKMIANTDIWTITFSKKKNYYYYLN